MNNALKSFAGYSPAVLCLLALAGVCAPAAVEASVPYGQVQAGDVISVPLERIRPMQMAVGRKAVSVRVIKLREYLALGSERFDEYLLKKKGKGVVGPGGTHIFLADGHHLGSALLEVEKPAMHVEILFNASALSQEAFFELVQERNWIYPYDESGKLRSVQALPQHLRELRDDPYRSLAWLLKKARGFTESKEHFFIEFKVADYLRALMPDLRPEMTEPQWVAAIATGLEHLRSPAAAQIPGYIAGDALTFRGCVEAIEALAHYFDIPR